MVFPYIIFISIRGERHARPTEEGHAWLTKPPEENRGWWWVQRRKRESTSEQHEPGTESNEYRTLGPIP